VRHEPAGKLRISGEGPNQVTFHPQRLCLAVATGESKAPLVIIELKR
jgi:hypothetical protein